MMGINSKLESIQSARRMNLAGVMNLDRVYPINISYKNSARKYSN